MSKIKKIIESLDGALEFQIPKLDLGSKNLLETCIEDYLELVALRASGPFGMEKVSQIVKNNRFFQVELQEEHGRHKLQIRVDSNQLRAWKVSVENGVDFDENGYGHAWQAEISSKEATEEVVERIGGGLCNLLPHLVRIYLGS